MPFIVSTTSPNSEGEMLWCVHLKSSYYDDDPRMPGTVPVDSYSYVLARGRDEAIKKATPDIEKARKRSDKNASEEIEAKIVTLEDLVVAQKSKDDGRLGWVSTAEIKKVELTSKEDTARYRLAVCLVPIE